MKDYADGVIYAGMKKAGTTESGVPETHAYPGELRGTHISVMA